MKVTSDHHPFVAFKGYLAKTNMDLVNAYDTFEPGSDDEKTYLKVKDCTTKEERLQCLKDIFNQRVAAAKAAKYTTAVQDLINMDAENTFVKWTRQFALFIANMKGAMMERFIGLVRASMRNLRITSHCFLSQKKKHPILSSI